MCHNLPYSVFYSRKKFSRTPIFGKLWTMYLALCVSVCIYTLPKIRELECQLYIRVRTNFARFNEVLGIILKPHNAKVQIFGQPGHNEANVTFELEPNVGGSSVKNLICHRG